MNNRIILLVLLLILIILLIVLLLLNNKEKFNIYDPEYDKKEQEYDKKNPEYNKKEQEYDKKEQEYYTESLNIINLIKKNHINGVAISNNSEMIICFSNIDNLLYISHNYGKSWNIKLLPKLYEKNIWKDIYIIDTNKDNKIFILIGKLGKIYISNSEYNGDKWELISEYICNDITNSENGRIIFIATNNGILINELNGIGNFKLIKENSNIMNISTSENGKIILFTEKSNYINIIYMIDFDKKDKELIVKKSENNIADLLLTNEKIYIIENNILHINKNDIYGNEEKIIWEKKDYNYSKINKIMKYNDIIGNESIIMLIDNNIILTQGKYTKNIKKFENIMKLCITKNGKISIILSNDNKLYINNQFNETKSLFETLPILI
tara:strand:- start:2400 stop:3545 length:1146 start_codon:yes stop_codon:yes gene_type:complete